MKLQRNADSGVGVAKFATLGNNLAYLERVVKDRGALFKRLDFQ